MQLFSHANYYEVRPMGVVSRKQMGNLARTQLPALMCTPVTEHLLYCSVTRPFGTHL
jgi:hypothetical protein